MLKCNMLRIIARLDIKNDLVIKGIHLEGQRRIGDPVELATQYYAQGVDEILFMDSVASLYDRNNLSVTVERACKSVFVPITIGGGIRNIEDVERALASGADKVAVNTALARDPELAERIAKIYGSQCLVGSIEAKRTDSGWQAYISNGREPTGRNVIEWAQELEQRGVGELLVTSVDREGTRKGFDLDLYEEIAKVTTVPVVACGGAGNLSHIQDLVAVTELQGIALASVLHYSICTLDELKTEIPGTSVRRRIKDACNT